MEAKAGNLLLKRAFLFGRWATAVLSVPSRKWVCATFES